LNACYSQRTGQELADFNVPNISATGSLPDCAAQRFSAEFYKAIGLKNDVGKAFRTAVDILSMEAVEGHVQFVFFPEEPLPQHFTATDQPEEWWEQRHAACVLFIS
jgi:hypothetical protein